MRTFLVLLVLTLGLASSSGAQQRFYGPNAGGYGPQAVGGGSPGGGALTIGTIALSTTTFPSGTAYSGTATVGMSGSGSMSQNGSLALDTTSTCSGSASSGNASFTLGSNWVLSGPSSGGPYNICFKASVPGATNTPVYQAFTITATGAASITDVYFSGGGTTGLHAANYVQGAASDIVIAAVNVPLSSGTFTGTLALGGTDAAKFKLSSTTLPSNLTCPTGGATCPLTAGPQHITIIPTQAGLTGSGTGVAMTLTGVGYQGMGDIAPSAQLYYGTVAYTNAYAAAAGKALQVRNASTTCDVVFKSNGDLDQTVAGGTCSSVGTPIATFCSGTCNVVTAYNQTTPGFDVSNPTASQQPQLVLNAYNGHACMRFVAANTQKLWMGSGTLTPVPQPLTEYVIAMRNGSAQAPYYSSFAGNFEISFGAGSSANSFQMYAGGTAFSVTGPTDNALHLLGMVANNSNATSVLQYDGTEPSMAGNNAGTNGTSTMLDIGGDTGAGATFNGDICAVGFWPVGAATFTPTLRGQMHTWASPLWGTP